MTLTNTFTRNVIILCSFVFILVFIRYWSAAGPEYKVKNSAVASIDSDFISVPIDVIMDGDPIVLQQDDPRIKKYIWDHEYLVAPSSEPYNLMQPNKNPSMGQGQFIQKLFGNKKEGFFIETGALDGETRSNTLYLEKLGWKGLLVEADPKNYAQVVQKNRKAWISNSCMATKPYPHKVIFQQHFNIGKIKNESSKNSKNIGKGNGKNTAIVQCFPLYSLLNALSVDTVDYFSLDVEGTEMELLANIPFDKIFIKTLSVEFSHVPSGKQGLLDLMEEKGYVSVGEVTDPGNLANDFIFVHKSLSDLIKGAR